MRKLVSLSKRNLLEIIRDPLSLVFCLAFPIVMLVFMQIIMSGISYVPANFDIKSYAVGICVFGYAFTGMFLAMGVSGDKNTSFINRIKISPVKKSVYLLSYLISGLPITIIQTVLFVGIALIFKLPFDYRLILIVLFLLPSQIFYLTFGITLGSLCKNEKQAGPMCSIIISLAGILGGVFMPVTTFSGGFKTFINILPFAHSVQIASDIYTVGAGCFIKNLPVLAVYVLGLWLLIIVVNLCKKK